MSSALTRLALIFLFGTLTACGAAAPCSEPTYEGVTSDEAWRSLVDAEGRVEVGHASAPQITRPTDGQTIDAASGPLEVKWTAPTAALPGHDRPAHVKRGRAHALSRLYGFFVGDAEAHLPPVTGEVYELQIQIPGERCPYLAVTSETSVTLSAEAWSRMVAAKKPLSIRLTRAYLVNNRITEGPYRPASATTFQVQ